MSMKLIYSLPNEMREAVTYLATELIQYDAPTFLVGGCVRDLHLGLQPKDLDVVVDNMPLDTLLEHLSKLGIVMTDGYNYGVLKVTLNAFPDIELDVAVPRKEETLGLGHKDIKVEHGKYITIHHDLARRDFTINAIAINVLNFIVYDPFYGCDDIKNKWLRNTTEAFHNDPLRLWRAISFLSRLEGFKLASTTEFGIQLGIENSANLPNSRLIDQLKKIYEGPQQLQALKALNKLGFLPVLNAHWSNSAPPNLTKIEGYYPKNWHDQFTTRFETFADFLYALFEYIYTEGPYKELNKLFGRELAGKVETVYELHCLSLRFKNTDIDHLIIKRTFRALVKAYGRFNPSSFFVDKRIEALYYSMEAAQIPFKESQLAIKPMECFPLGISGKDISTVRAEMLEKVWAGEIENDYTSLYKYLQEIRLKYE